VVCQLAVHLSVGFVHRVQFFMGFLKFLQLVGGVDQDAVCLVRVDVDVDVGGGDCLEGGVGSASEGFTSGRSYPLRDVVLGYGREHHRVVVLLLGVFVLQTHDLEALPADVASVDGSFADEVEHLLVGVGVVLHTGPVQITILQELSEVKTRTGLSTVPNWECTTDSISCHWFSSMEFCVM